MMTSRILKNAATPKPDEKGPGRDLSKTNPQEECPGSLADPTSTQTRKTEKRMTDARLEDDEETIDPTVTAVSV